MSKQFNFGQVVLTRGINDAIAENTTESMLFTKQVVRACRRYRAGDWGDLCEEDKAANDFAVDNELRILAAYETCKGKIWIITEWDRSVTTILFPHEY